MRCDICGTERKSEDHECSTCKYAESKIQVLTPEEKDRFKGVTIDQGNFNDQQFHDAANPRHGSKQRIYVKHTNFNLANTGIITKLLIIAALIFAVFVALPLVMLLVGIGVVIWLIIRK